jgi:hypothetical protein
LKEASYLKPGEQPSYGSYSNSFDIVDAVSQEVVSSTGNSKKTGKGSKESKDESLNLSDRIKSVVSERPTGSAGQSNSFSISALSAVSKNSTLSPKTPEEDNNESENDKLREQYSLEKSMIDMKYQQQISALEKKSKPGNPLTKRLMAKIQSEWNSAIQKKKDELGISGELEQSLD